LITHPLTRVMNLMRILKNGKKENCNYSAPYIKNRGF